MIEAVVSLGAGLLFAAGLALSGMTRPEKVAGFLDVAGAWDPSLALVMAGAVSAYAAAARLSVRRGRPLLGGEQPPAPSRRIDAPLIAGAALFGVGWGASGFCPGPALVSLGAGSLGALVFVPAMVAGMAVHRALAAAPRPVEAKAAPQSLGTTQTGLSGCG